MTRTVFFSTGAFKNSAVDTIDLLGKHGVRDIELSAGAITPDIEKEVIARSADFNLQVHNYFPPADNPFVYNLASSNPLIRQKTIDAMKNSVELTASINSNVYSLHSGFLVDPPVTYLGGTWQGLEKESPERALENFVKSVQELNNYSQNLGVSLLVENNVLNTGTMLSSGEDVLLMASPDQIIETMKLLPEQVSLLLDVAHLKVSCHTLKLDQVQSIRDINSLVGGYHLSDNDGTADSAGLVSEESWFWKELREDVSFATLEVKTTTWTESEEQVLLSRSLWIGE